MTIDEDILHDVQESLARCAHQGPFHDRICMNFKAANVPLPSGLSGAGGRQQQLFREDLTRLLLCAANPDFATGPGAVPFQVPPQISRYWIDALLKTVRECDSKFTPELERKWRSVLTEGLAASGTKRFRFPA